eukprot:6212750-Pleurochrysis_carterae.AAC.3
MKIFVICARIAFKFSTTHRCAGTAGPTKAQSLLKRHAVLAAQSPQASRPRGHEAAGPRRREKYPRGETGVGTRIGEYPNAVRSTQEGSAELSSIGPSDSPAAFAQPEYL